MIRIDKVTKAYGRTVVVDAVTLDLPKKGLTSIIGPNGAGKSTLLSMMSRLMPMDSGTITVDGLDVTTTPGDVLARKLAILRQDNAMTSRLTVRELVAVIRIRKGGRRQRTVTMSNTRSPISNSARWPTGSWTNCPAASASAPSWRWCCARIRITCCSTSR